MRTAAILLALFAAACADHAADKARQVKAEQRAEAATKQIVCARSREDIALALPSLADATDRMDEPTREDTLQQMVKQVDCAKPA